MADSKKEIDTDETPQPKASMMPVIFISLGVFVVSVAGFSWMEGLFGPPPETPKTEVIHDAVPDEFAEPSSEAQQGYMRKQTVRPGSLLDEAINPKDDTTDYAAESMWIEREKKNLKLERAAIDKKKKELQALHKKVQSLLGQVEKEKTQRIVMMAKLYDNMDPEAVAKQINNMADKTVIRLLPQMNTRTAAKVMALIDPKRAANITTKLLALDQ